MVVNNTLLELRQELFEFQYAYGSLEYIDIHKIMKKYIEAEENKPKNINDLKRQMGLSYYNDNPNFI